MVAAPERQATIGDLELFFVFDSATLWKLVIGKIEAAAEPLELFEEVVVLAAANNWAKFPAKCKPFTLFAVEVGDDAADTNKGVASLSKKPLVTVVPLADAVVQFGIGDGG